MEYSKYSFLASTHSAPNLFLNGAFELNDHSFWTPEGYPVQISEAPMTSEKGSRRFGVVQLNSESPFFYTFNLRYNTQASTDFKIEKTVSGLDRFDIPCTNPGSSYGQERIPAYFDDSLYGCSVTLGVSIKVVGGGVNLYAVFRSRKTFSDSFDASGDSLQEYTRESSLLASNFRSSDWDRLTATHSIGESSDNSGYVGSVGIMAERVSGAPTIYFGRLQLVEGEYKSAPYTRCRFCASVPQDAIFMSYGEIPPGFEAVDDSDDYFIRLGTPGETGGSTNHDSHSIKQLMRDNLDEGSNDDNWYKSLLINDKMFFSDTSQVEADSLAIDNGEVSHSHDMESPGRGENSIPNFRGVTLCRRKR